MHSKSTDKLGGNCHMVQTVYTFLPPIPPESLLIVGSLHKQLEAMKER